jgi:hypothetical protein
MATLTVEKNRRSPFGWLVAVIFWGFNLFMIVWMVVGISSSADRYSQLTDSASKTGAAIGATLGVTIILWIWFFGATVLGLMMFFTRGKKIIVTTETP